MVRSIFTATLCLLARAILASDVPPPDICDEVGLALATCMKENAKICYPSCSKVDSAKRGPVSCENVLDFSCPMNNCCEPCAEVGASYILCQTSILGCPTDCLEKTVSTDTIPSERKK